MDQHTIILEIPKTEIPNENLSDFISAMIAQGGVIVDYSGAELDHCVDCEDELHEDWKNKSYLSIHFDGEGINYQMGDENALIFVQELLSERRIADVRKDDKDTDIYL